MKTGGLSGIKGWERVLVLLLFGWSCGASPGRAPPEAIASQTIKSLIAQLGAEDFATRDEADRKLLALGRVSVPPLLEAAKDSESPEIRVRSRTLVDRIRSRFLQAEFERMGRLPDDHLDVEQAMWLIALFLDPGLERQVLTRQLDHMAAAVRKRLGENVEAADLPPREAITVLISSLRDDFQLSGDKVTYHHPDNSSAYRVIKRRKGLPILLSEIAVAVARRVDIPVVGLGVPGRYMIKYDGGRAPAGADQRDIFINPFEGWREMTVQEISLNAAGFNPNEHLTSYPPRETILRMMRNMENHAMVTGRQDLVDAIRRCSGLVAPNVVPFR